MRNYHVMLTDGKERNIRADDVRIEANGALVFRNGTEIIVAYAAEAWAVVEVERKDDR
jgi:hypothetical protein